MCNAEKNRLAELKEQAAQLKDGAQCAAAQTAPVNSAPLTS